MSSEPPHHFKGDCSSLQISTVKQKSPLQEKINTRRLKFIGDKALPSQVLTFYKSKMLGSNQPESCQKKSVKKLPQRTSGSLIATLWMETRPYTSERQKPVPGG